LRFQEVENGQCGQKKLVILAKTINEICFVSLKREQALLESNLPAIRFID
jgi:hypothetical protein